MTSLGLPVIAITLVLVACAAWLLFTNLSKSGSTNELSSGDTIRVRDIPDVVRRLKAKASEPSWATFAFSSGNKREADAVNLQFSYENGSVGLDWVLLAPRNIKDRELFSDLVKREKQTLTEKQMNGVRYLRVEDGDVVKLGLKVIRDTYGLSDGDEVEIIADGFDWRRDQ